MAWTTQKWINFRSTAAYVTDGTGQVVLPGRAGSTNEKRAYPESLTVNSDTFNAGFSTGANTDGMRDRSTGTTNKQLAGAALVSNSSGSPHILKVELLGGVGDYEIRLAVGDPSGIGTTHPHVVIKDGTTTLATINGTSGIANWMDAGGTSRNDADWGTNNVALTLTFSDTSGTGSTPIMYIELGNTATAGYTPLAAVGIKYLGAGSDVTVGITGNAATGSPGTVAPSTSKALTGNAATSATGTVAVSTSPALTGNAATGATGSIALATSVGLTGNAGTGAAGTVSPSVGVTVALTGVSASGNAGTVAPSASVALSGNAGSGAVGTVSPANGVTVALTGVSATGGAGTVAASASVAVSGNAATGSAGAVVPAISKAIDGNANTGAAGSVAPAASIGLAGNSATATPGTINVAGSAFATLTGVQAAGAVGTVTARVDALLGPRPGGARSAGTGRMANTSAARPGNTSRTRSSNR